MAGDDWNISYHEEQLRKYRRQAPAGPSEQQLLDDLDDARHDVRHFRRWQFGLAAAAGFGTLLVVAGVVAALMSAATGIDLGGTCAAMILPGVAVAITAFVALAAYSLESDDSDAPAGLRRAERNYRDHLLK